jgi:hypothetical protein
MAQRKIKISNFFCGSVINVFSAIGVLVIIILLIQSRFSESSKNSEPFSSSEHVKMIVSPTPILSILPLQSGWVNEQFPIVELFQEPSKFTITSPDISIQNGILKWKVYREYQSYLQYAYRPIPNFDGDVVLTVKGSINSFTNNCAVSVGIGPTVGQGIAISFGFFGGGCSGDNLKLPPGPIVMGKGATFNYSEPTTCQYKGNWLRIPEKTSVTATLTVQGKKASLSVPDVGVARATDAYSGNYNTLYIGYTGDGDHPSCSGTIESVTIKSLKK